MPTDLRKARELFLHAVGKLPAEQWEGYVAEACGEDADLAQQVGCLLQVHREAGSFLDAPAPGLELPGTSTALYPRLAEGPGTVIGPYKLLQQIGEGGMGVVFMAEQTEPIKRTVALKIIKPGMDTRQVIARFEAERQAVAMMDHPNIAKVLDAGTTDSGRPYFVMELVKGVPITKYCDEKHLPLRARLELFVQVCQAVQHAHQKGIIHRDIKPNNVLVAEYDNRAVPKVIDFGVAKATAHRLTEHTMFTEFGQVLGTMEYMSPEQSKFNQLDIDTRSDIYSLGVLLYELLAGSTPFEGKRLKEAAFDEMLRIIREEEPPKPSTRLSSIDTLPSVAANRHTEPARLSKDVRGELDWIVMKALEKDRNRRYETASGFAADIERHLRDEPVEAGPPSAAYRFRKFASRNKSSLLTAGLLAAMLLAGVVLLTVNNVRLKAEQARTHAESERTKTQFERAQTELLRADGNLAIALSALDEVFMTKIEYGVHRNRRLTQEDRRFLQKGLEFYEQFAARNSAHPGLQAETARAYRRAAEIQMTLARWPEAESAFRKAIPLFENIRVQTPDFAAYRREFAFCLDGLSRALSQQQRPGEAIKAAERALPYWESIAASGTDRPDVRLPLAHCLGQQGLALAQDRQYDKAERTFVRALDLYAKLKNDFPQDRGYRQEWAYTHSCLAYAVLRPTKRLAEAEQHLQVAIAAYRALAEEAPDDFWYPRCVANELKNLGYVLKEMGQSTAVEKLNREEIELEENIIARGPPDINEHQHLLAAYVGDLAHLLTDSKRFLEAEPAYRRSATIRETIIADLTDPDDEPERQNQRRLLSEDYVGLIQTLRLAAEQAATDERLPEDDRKAAATGFRTRAREIEREATRSGHLAAAGLNTLAWTIVVEPNSDTEDIAWAGEMARKAVELVPNDDKVWNTLGVCQLRAGEFKQAVASLDKSRQLRHGGSSYDFFFLAMAHWQLGDKDEARNWYDKAVVWMEKNQPQNKELLRFRAEAEDLLKITGKTSTTKPPVEVN